MPQQSPKVVITNAALDEEDGELVLRGVIDADSLRALNTPPYQREILGEAKIQKLMDVHRVGRVVDVDLNMRGQRVRETGGVFELLDPVYIVDGLQRITAGIRVMNEDPPTRPRIGATIYLGKDEAWERKRFEALNLDRTKLSPNVHLRNQKDEVPAVQALFRLTADQSFILKGKVQWNQQPKKMELITATTYLKTVGRLHGHLGPGKGSDVRSVAAGVDRIMESIGRKTLTDNVRAFFDLIEECWSISDIEMRQGATILKANFLMVLANVLSDHEDFWTEDRLTVPASLVQKLKRFKVTDTFVVQLAGSGGTSSDILYDLIVKHINSGKRTRHLQRRGRSASDLAKNGDEA